MKVLKIYALFSLLLLTLWTSLMLILIIVEKYILKLKISSAERSIIGMSLYFLWLLGWYYIFRVIAFKLTKNVPPYKR